MTTPRVTRTPAATDRGPGVPSRLTTLAAEPESPIDEARHNGATAAAISNAVVKVLRDYTGRGPTQARTLIGPDTIVVTLRDSLTKAERTLADHGQALEVLAMRRAFQGAMRDELIVIVEHLTGQAVTAFLSDNLHDPDVAVEIFLLASTTPKE